jgi:hypothetical protein
MIADPNLPNSVIETDGELLNGHRILSNPVSLRLVVDFWSKPTQTVPLQLQAVTEFAQFHQ